MDKIKEIINKLLGKGNDSSDNSGFTLIELLIVIAVIGILAAALLVAIDPIDKVRAGNDTKVINDVRAIYDAANRYYAQQYEAPTSGGWETEITDNTGELKAIPQAPGDYDDYVYLTDGDSIVVYGEQKSKSSKEKAGNIDADPAYFVATAGGGCYTTGTPNVNTLPDDADDTQCQ